MRTLRLPSDSDVTQNPGFLASELAVLITIPHNLSEWVKYTYPTAHTYTIYKYHKHPPRAGSTHL